MGPGAIVPLSGPEGLVSHSGDLALCLVFADESLNTLLNEGNKILFGFGEFMIPEV